MIKKQVQEDFNKEIFGYKKVEVDEFINELTLRIETLSKDVRFLKKELKKFEVKNNEKEILKPIKKD